MKLSTIFVALITIVSATAITIPPIADVTPGTTFVMSVTINGNGTYQLEIPKLAFGSYEVPESVVVKNERSVPVLIHVDKNAEPGLYVISVRAGNEQTSARIRIISYTHTTTWWFLIPIGILVIVAGILLSTQFARRKPPKNQKQEDLITYY